MKYVAAGLLLWWGSTGIACAEEPSVALRYPVAVVRIDEQTLATANERSGTLSLVDLKQHKVIEEVPVGKRLSALAVTADGRLVVTDSAASAVITLRRNLAGVWEVRARLAVEREPRSIVISRDGQTVFVASRWGRKVEVLALSKDGKLAKQGALVLPFPAGTMALLADDKHLVVADAFGGRLTVVDTKSQAILSTRQIGGHNIAALVCDNANDRLLVAHQILASSLPITLDNIQWGAVMKNVVRIIPQKELLAAKNNLATTTRVIALGQEGDGSADPTAVLPLEEGAFAVALGGADELVVVESTGLVVKRLPLGRRPVALLPGGNRREVIALNQFDSSLSIVDLDKDQILGTVSLGPAPQLTAPQRGEQLFYDARLSFEKWMSCHSCHTDGHTNGVLADTLGDNTFGAPKRTLTLLGTRDTDRWAWNGEVKELHDQVRKSVETSMHGRASADEVYDLTAFLHTLAPPPPLLPDAADAADAMQLARGAQVFKEQKCNECHIPPLTYTSHDVYDVGMPDENKQAKFNPPSLRGVGQASSFFHDSRATALEDVLDLFGHQLRETLRDDDRAALLRFLHSL